MDSVVQVSNHTVDLKLEPQKEQSFSVQIMYKSVFKTIQCVCSLNPKGTKSNGTLFCWDLCSLVEVSNTILFSQKAI